jgi:CRP-like cAMP-binding protein
MSYDIFIKCSLFEGIESNEIRSMTKCLDPRIENFKKNDFIVLEGDKLTGIGIVLEGEITILKESYSGDGMVLRKLKECQVFGEVAVFAGKQKWPASVQATKNTTIAFLKAEKVKGDCPYLCPRHSQFIKNLLSLISRRAAFLNKKMDYLSIKSMRGKIAAFLWDEYISRETLSFELRLNRQEMADYLNVSRPSMSRELGRMKDEGVLDFHKSSFKILDETALRAMALS